MHGLYWYDNNKRWYDPILSRFTTMDPLCEKYYDKNPYAYCGDNPMKYGDVNGDSINVIAIQRFDKANGTNFLQTIIDDLQVQTGLTFTVSSSGALTYAKSDDGQPMVTTTTDDNGNSVQIGSATARTLMTSAIDHQDWATVEMGGRSGVRRGTNEIGLNFKQINKFIKGAVNLDNRTLGWGMTLMHELHHTKVGGALSDAPFNPGAVVTQMNIIRSELNAQGRNYGQRLDYFGVSLGNNVFLPFDKVSKGLIRSGLIPSAPKFIRF